MQFTLAARRLFFVSIAAVSCCCCCSKCFFKALIQPRKETETKLKGDSRRLFYFILFYFIYFIYFISLKEQKETKERQIKSSYALLRFGFAEFILHSFQRCCCCRLLLLLLLQLLLLLLQLSDGLLEGSLSSPSHSPLMRTCKTNPKP